MPAFNLLSPVLASIDPRGRTPIINAKASRGIRKLGIRAKSLGDQCERLVSLIGPDGYASFAELDWALGSDDFTPAAKQILARSAARRTRSSAPIGNQDDSDLLVITKTQAGRVRRRHNSMTNSLRELCQAYGLEVSGGAGQDCEYDALVSRYRGSRDLLIEVKTDDLPAQYHSAIGQLLDYHRGVPRRKSTDLAVLFPAEPSSFAASCIRDVGIKVLWFQGDQSQIVGDWRLG